MPEQSITITIEAGHVVWIENQANKAGVPVETWVNNLIGLSQKTLPEIFILSVAATAEMRRVKGRVV